MTEEEQDVYSLIGISPLVLVDREIKDPRNVIVTVALPGQAPKIANAVKSISVDLEQESSFESHFVDAEVIETKFAEPEVMQTEVVKSKVNEPEVDEPEVDDIKPEVVDIVQTIGSAVTNSASNGVILRVNRAQPVDTDENLEAKAEFLGSSKEFVPIQSPEASRRKRSSASQA